MISKSLLCLQFNFSPFSKKFTTGSDPSYSVLHVEIKRLCVSLSPITGWFRTSLLPVRNPQDLGTLPPESLYSLSCLSILRVISFSFLPSSSLPSSTAHLICPEHDKRMPKNPSHPDVKHATFLPPPHTKHVLICQIFVSPFMAWKICQPEAYFGFWAFRAGRALPETTLCKL